MGGRSRRPSENDRVYADREKWILTVSDSRLEQYGRMSAHKIDQGHASISKRYLNGLTSREFERRNGYKPEWDR
jgi:hypothetical protein